MLDLLTLMLAVIVAGVLAYIGLADYWARHHNGY